MAHIPISKDDGPRLVIDPRTRRIEGCTVDLVQGDGDSERIGFELPRYIDGHDMSEAEASVHYRHEDAEDGEMYPVDDLHALPNSPSTVAFTWLASRNVTKEPGKVEFLVKFRCYDGENVVYEWNTALSRLVRVMEGMDYLQGEVEDYPDALKGLLLRVEALEEREAASIDPTLTVEGSAADAKAVGEALAGKQPAGDYALRSELPEVPENVSAFANDAGYLAEESDPTVPSWAKQADKPTYTAEEVGADESGSAADALTQAKAYADAQIAAIPTPDVSGQIGAHNADPDAHQHIQSIVSGLSDRLNAIADSDDTTLDQLSELVAYIKDNRSLIEQVTTGKVSVSDIVDNLATSASDKPLSAAQGVVLKALIDAIVVPTNVSAFNNDAGYLTSFTESDPTVPAWAKAASKPSYTAAEVGALPSTTVIPTVPTKVSAFENDKGYLTEHQSLADYVKSSELATVAKSGSYSDLSGKPTNHVTYTSNGEVSVVGSVKPTYTYLPPANDGVKDTNSGAAFFPEGIIIGGSAASAGLVTRGVCGITTPDENTGECEKDNLYINYDGRESNNAYNENRQLVLQAGEIGAHYGNNLYQFAAARGDAVKAWVEAKGYQTAAQVTTIVNNALGVIENGSY